MEDECKTEHDCSFDADMRAHMELPSKVQSSSPNKGSTKCSGTWLSKKPKTAMRSAYAVDDGNAEPETRRTLGIDEEGRSCGACSEKHITLWTLSKVGDDWPPVWPIGFDWTRGNLGEGPATTLDDSQMVSSDKETVLITQKGSSQDTEYT